LFSSSRYSKTSKVVFISSTFNYHHFDCGCFFREDSKCVTITTLDIVIRELLYSERHTPNSHLRTNIVMSKSSYINLKFPNLCISSHLNCTYQMYVCMFPPTAGPAG
jgi:hypothetical protein